MDPAPITFTTTDPISVISLDIERGRMRARLRIREGSRYVDPVIAKTVVKRFPSIDRHTCKNDEGPYFGSVMDHTSTAHLLEHLIIDAQLRDGSTPPDRIFTGWTQWVDEENGIADVEVSFADDLVAARALGQSLTYLNDLLQ